MNNGIVNIKELNDLIASKSNIVNLVNQGMNQTIVGQKHLIDSLLIALLSNGHILLEGVPGLAKTLAIKNIGIHYRCKVQSNTIYSRFVAGRRGRNNDV